MRKSQRNRARIVFWRRNLGITKNTAVLYRKRVARIDRQPPHDIGRQQQPHNPQAFAIAFALDHPRIDVVIAAIGHIGSNGLAPNRHANRALVIVGCAVTRTCYVREQDKVTALRPGEVYSNATESVEWIVPRAIMTQLVIAEEKL